MEKIMSVSSVTKEYLMGEVKVLALRSVSFELFSGEFVVILGPSGSGKSTLLNIIGGIDTPSSGEIIFEGKDISRLSTKELTDYRKNEIGFVFQFYNLIPELTALENITIASSLSKSSIPEEELLEKVGLSERRNHFPSQMSGGEQQRIAIARALAKNPKILLCDEPTGALDYETGVSVLRVLKDFNKQYKKTVLIITHNAAIADMGDRVFHVKDGLISKISVNQSPIEPEDVKW